MELIDKAAVIAEIERKIKSINSCPFRTAELGSEKFDKGQLNAYNEIISYLDTLEVREVNNDSNHFYKEALKFIEDHTQIVYRESRDVEGFRRGLDMEKEYYVEQYFAKKAVEIAMGYKKSN